uniref:Uncharacterized protein n=1 Tax=Anopheles atroparvus TaxID=41427 RepID=A0AAG5D6W8_ANOAO
MILAKKRSTQPSASPSTIEKHFSSLNRLIGSVSGKGTQFLRKWWSFNDGKSPTRSHKINQLVTKITQQERSSSSSSRTWTSRFSVFLLQLEENQGHKEICNRAQTIMVVVKATVNVENLSLAFSPAT